MATNETTVHHPLMLQQLSVKTGRHWCARVQQHPALERREACLSIRTAYDPLQFVVEPLHHPVAPRFGASVRDRHLIIGQPIPEADQFLDLRGSHSRFPLLQPALSFALAQQVTEVFTRAYRRKNCCGCGGISLELIQALTRRASALCTKEYSCYDHADCQRRLKEDSVMRSTFSPSPDAYQGRHTAPLVKIFCSA
jgi:hypothetical protein